MPTANCDITGQASDAEALPPSRAARAAAASDSAESADPTGAALLAQIRRSLIGQRAALQTPFGERPLIYADYTASGRSLGFLEDNIRRLVLPFYANTHTEASFTGAQTNELRESARQAIRSAVGGSEQDKVIFCGAGATAAINRLVAIMGLRLPAQLATSHNPVGDIPEAERPVVFVGPYEHHSNELPWRESIADVVRIGLTADGEIDVGQLARELEQYRDRPLLIGSFSAASNVTGVRSDVAGITRMLKSAGALAFWDYAAAGPYVDIDMNRDQAPIDAVFLSPHKFVGGPGTPGVLVVKAQLLQNPVPAIVGGGTVSYVSPTEHRYLSDPEHREEGGTPGIVESIRAGAVFALKEQIGIARIEAIEQRLVQRALAAFVDMPQVEVLGPQHPGRLGIFSLRIRHAGKDLHYGYVAALLNDLFGIQARGGCSCAGPYGHELLGISAQESTAIESVVEKGYECFKPGWIRINLHYAMTAEEVDYLLGALRLVAAHGWRLLPSYRLDAQRGQWTHREASRDLPVRFRDLLSATPGDSGERETCLAALDELLDLAAQTLLAGAPPAHCRSAAREHPLPAYIEASSWFVLPGDPAHPLTVSRI